MSNIFVQINPFEKFLMLNRFTSFLFAVRGLELVEVLPWLPMDYLVTNKPLN